MQRDGGAMSSTRTRPSGQTNRIYFLGRCPECTVREPYLYIQEAAPNIDVHKVASLTLSTVDPEMHVVLSSCAAALFDPGPRG